MGTENQLCSFCKSNLNSDSLCKYLDFYSVDCDICGYYKLDRATVEQINFRHNDFTGNNHYDFFSKNFTTNPNIFQKNMSLEETILWKSKNYNPTYLGKTLTNDLEDYELKKMPLLHEQKPSLILKLINKKVQSENSPFHKVPVSLKEIYQLGICGGDELWRWVLFLQNNNLIEKVDRYKGWEKKHPWNFGLTPEGLSTIQSPPDSRKFIFIAMQFSDEKWASVIPENSFTKKKRTDGYSRSL